MLLPPNSTKQEQELVEAVDYKLIQVTLRDLNSA